MASLEERKRLLEDKAFREQLFFCALGKVKDKGTAYLLVMATLTALGTIPGHELEKIKDFKAYTFGILRNLVLQHYAKERKADRIHVIGDEEMGDKPVPELNEKIEARNLVDKIALMVKQDMPLIAQQVFELHFRKGYKIAEVAGELEKSEVYIRGIIYDIRQSAKRKFKHEY